MGNTTNTEPNKKLVKETRKTYDILEYTDGSIGSIERIKLNFSSGYEENFSSGYEKNFSSGYEEFSALTENKNKKQISRNVAQGSKLIMQGGIMRPIPISVKGRKK